MAPFRPCAFRSRPTLSCVLAVSATSVVGVDDVDANAATVGEGGDERAERLRGAAGTADHATEVLGVHMNLEDLATCARRGDDLHFVRVIDDPLDEVFERGLEQGFTPRPSRSRRGPLRPSPQASRPWAS